MCNVPETKFEKGASDRNSRPVLASSIRLDVFINSYGLRRYQVTNKRCVDISGRRFACTLTEKDRESSRMRASASKQVSVPGPLPSRRLRTRTRTA